MEVSLKFFNRVAGAAHALVDNKVVRVEYNDFVPEGLTCVDLIHMLQVFVDVHLGVTGRKVYAEMIPSSGAYRFKLSR